MNVDQVRTALDKACDQAGSLRKWAKANKFSPAFVSDVIRGNRPPSETILAALGLEKIERPVTYRKKTEAA
jgi:hypothetical protein